MKLSKGVMGLKFMKRTLIANEKKEVEQKHKKHFKAEIESTTTPAQQSSSSSSAPIKVEIDSVSETKYTSKDCTVVVCPSYLHCERFNYARQSYGGMNTWVEENIRKGLWKMEYEIAHPEDEQQLESSSSHHLKYESIESMVDSDHEGGPEYKINLKYEGVEEEEGELDSDEQDRRDLEGPVYGSIIGTIGKKFNRKHNKQKQKQDKEKNNDGGDSMRSNNYNDNSSNRKRPHEDDQTSQSNQYQGGAAKKKKKGFWKNKYKNKQK